MNQQQLLAAIANCDKEIAKANVFGQWAVKAGSDADRMNAGLWLMDWESEKHRLLAELSLEVRSQAA